MLRKTLLVLLVLSALAAYLYFRDTGTNNNEYVTPIDDPPPGPPPTRSEVLEDLAKNKPIKFLEDCLAHYEETVQGYRLTFLKQEFVNGKMGPKETIRAHFREKPFSVHMDWIEGKGKAARTLYVENENNGKLVARPLVFGRESPILFERRVDDPDAMASSRFSISRFGIAMGQRSTLAAIKAADQAGTLHLKYDGIVPLKEVGNRRCYKFVRAPYEPVEEDGIAHLTFYIDQETMLQVGSVLRNTKMELIAEYFFRDIELNPTFHADQFTRKKL
jgi:hypothetical protein